MYIIIYELLQKNKWGAIFSEKKKTATATVFPSFTQCLLVHAK